MCKKFSCLSFGTFFVFCDYHSIQNVEQNFLTSGISLEAKMFVEVKETGDLAVVFLRKRLGLTLKMIIV